MFLFIKCCNALLKCTACTKRTDEASALDSSPILMYTSKSDCFRRRPFAEKTPFAHVLIKLRQHVRGLSLPRRSKPPAACGSPVARMRRMPDENLVPFIVSTNDVRQMLFASAAGDDRFFGRFGSW